MTTQDKKKTSWSYDKGIATVKFPDEVTQSFDTDLIDNAEVRLFLYHYGFKQFLSDKIAGIGKGATSEDKLKVFREYHELLKTGNLKKAVERTTTRKPTFIEFWEVIGKDTVPQTMAAGMYAKLYPVKKPVATVVPEQPVTKLKKATK